MKESTARIIEEHFELIFEMFVIFLLFVTGGLFIAFFPNNDKLIGFVTGGALMGAAVRGLFRSGNGGKSG